MDGEVAATSNDEEAELERHINVNVKKLQLAIHRSRKSSKSKRTNVGAQADDENEEPTVIDASAFMSEIIGQQDRQKQRQIQLQLSAADGEATDGGQATRTPSRTSVDASNNTTGKKETQQTGKGNSKLHRLVHRAFIYTPTASTPKQTLHDNIKKTLQIQGEWHQDSHETFTDVLYECQRGLIVFGIPRFSAAARIQFDPSPWTDANMRGVPYTPYNAPLPSPEWRWLHARWLIDMQGDVDESGWMYAFSFTTSGWRATPKTWRSFVRRRRWIRTRMRVYGDEDSEPANPNDEVSKQRDAQNTEEIYNSDFADRQTPYDFVEAQEVSDNFEGSLGRQQAYRLLPILPAHRTEILGWEGQLDARNPFLSWEWVKKEGSRLFDNSLNADGSTSTEELQTVWKSSLIEINLHRVERVLSNTKVDRQRLSLWKLWLHAEEPLPEGLEEKELPNLDDVWDLIEFRTEHLVRNFQYQSTLRCWFALLLDNHSQSHSKHKFEGFDQSQPLPEQISRMHLYGKLETLRDDCLKLQEDSSDGSG